MSGFKALYGRSAATGALGMKLLRAFASNTRGRIMLLAVLVP